MPATSCASSSAELVTSQLSSEAHTALPDQVTSLGIVRRAQVGEATAASYREFPQTDDDNEVAMANAIAMTDAEPW